MSKIHKNQQPLNAVRRRTDGPCLSNTALLDASIHGALGLGNIFITKDHMDRHSDKQHDTAHHTQHAHDSADRRTGTRRKPVGERGKRKRDLILDTALELLLSEGLEAINTNALAARASIAVGSIYQYFANKEEVLAALAERYFREMGGNIMASLERDITGLTIEEVVDEVIDPMVAFERRHPAFGQLLAGSELSGMITEGVLAIDREVLTALRDALFAFNPEMDPVVARRAAQTMKALYKGVSYLIQSEHNAAAEHEAREDSDAIIGNMKRFMVSYMTECLESSSSE